MTFRMAHLGSRARSRRLPAYLVAALFSCLAVGIAVPAAATNITVLFSGTVTGTTGDLSPVIAGASTITGSIVLADTATGAFTPSPNPTFVRSEMLYTGAVVSTSVTVSGDTVSGTGGNAELFDANGALAGEDEYDASGGATSGTIGGVATTSLLLALSYDMAAFTIASGDSLFAPPSPAGPFSLFTLTSATGAIAFGSVDSVTVVGVPEPRVLAGWLAPAAGLFLAIRRPRLLKEASASS